MNKFVEKIAYAVLLFGLSFFFSHEIKGQEIIQSLPIEKYEEISNALFPKNVESYEYDRQEYLIDVTVESSFVAPIQLSISKHRDNTFTVYRYSLANQNKSLGDQLIDLNRKIEQYRVESFVKSLNIQKSEVAISRLLVKEIEKFFSIQTKLVKDNNINLDGTRYKIRYVDANSKVYFSFVGGDLAEKGELPLITWARRIVNKATLLNQK